MNYREFSPHSALAPLVACYWMSDGDGQSSRIVPDACTDLIFKSGENDLPRMQAVGMMTYYRDVSSSSNTSMLGVRFKSGQLSRLTALPLSELKNEVIDGKQLLQLDMRFQTPLPLLRDLEKVRLLDGFLMRLATRSLREKDHSVEQVLHLLMKSKGTILIPDVVREQHLSQRQLERRFKARVGVSMKEMAGIIRFGEASDHLKKHPSESLTHCF